MSRSENRRERSQQRAEESSRRRKMQMSIVCIAFAVYMVVRVVWYGGIEFGLWQPLQTEEFKKALNPMNFFALTYLVSLLPWLPRFRSAKADEAAIEQQTTHDESAGDARSVP